MLSLPSLSSFVPNFSSNQTGPIKLNPVNVYDVETKKDKPSRTLKHLLKLNHANHAVLFNDRKFHNHLPHHLGSAYLLQASSEHLENVYDHDTDLVKWEDAPTEVTKDDWKDFLGKKEYERAYVDFFEDELINLGYDWKKVAFKYLFEGVQPVGNNLIGGLCHPLIHLGYAVELNSKEVAAEAFSLTATCYNFLHKYLDDKSYTRPSSKKSTDLLSLLEQIRQDKTFEFDGSDSMDKLFSTCENEILDYWNAWDLTDPTKQFEVSQHAAASLLSASGSFDFFFVHSLTSSHAVRILLPIVPAEWQLPLVRQWWLITIAVYIMQQRPKIDLDDINKFDTQGRDWAWVEKQGIEKEEWAMDAHFVKAIRALRECKNVWGDPDQFYLKAAVKFVSQFNGWAFQHLESEHRYH